ncbi:MAG: hypothetical protein HN392_06705 [Anaerolineae bacterium]|jgi:hypothetical protein|nr:hypothetical protein [Anaerolineae bacterium]
MKTEKKAPSRKYPPFYEKIIPVTLIILILVIAGVLITAFGVALGLVG